MLEKNEKHDEEDRNKRKTIKEINKEHSLWVNTKRKCKQITNPI